MMTLEVVTLPAAERDLEAIAVYTKRQWGSAQARRYMSALRLDVGSLAEFPMRHPVYRNTRCEFRKMRSGHHVIFYVVRDDRVEIVRVLHERMDVGSVLDLG